MRQRLIMNLCINMKNIIRIIYSGCYWIVQILWILIGRKMKEIENMYSFRDKNIIYLLNIRKLAGRI